MTVDTLKIAKDLRAADLPPAQAEAIAAAIGISVLESAATKADLLQLKTELEAKIEQLKSSLLMWMIATQLTFTGIIIAAMKL